MFFQSPADDSVVACPCCSSTKLEKYQDRKDNTGRPILMFICMDCTLIVNVTDLVNNLKEGSNLDKQRQGSEGFYKVDEKTIAETPQKVDELRNVLKFALDRLPKDFHKGTFADFGAGLGYAAAAAALDFKQAYAIDINTLGIKQLMSAFPKTDNMRICSDWSEVDQNLDFINLWHVVEDFPDARSMMDMFVAKLNSGGAIYMEVPMLKHEHVFDGHYSFFGEPSFRILCENAGLENVRVWYATVTECMICLAQKPMA